MDYVTIPLFSTPVYSTKIDVSSCPNLESVDWEEGHGHHMSRDNFLLDQTVWQSLKTQIMFHMEQFFYRELRASPDCKINMTTSVANKNYPAQSHPRHSHANSIISGCVYFDYHPAKIRFVRRSYNQIKYDMTDYNYFNSEVWEIAPEPGLLLMWPSELEHEVESSDANTPVRYSIAFNSWLSGDVNTFKLALLRL